MSEHALIQPNTALVQVLEPLTKKQQSCLMWMLILGAEKGRERADITSGTYYAWRSQKPAFRAADNFLKAYQDQYAQEAFIMLATKQGILAIEQFSVLNEMSWAEAGSKRLVNAKLKVAEFFGNRILPIIERKEIDSYERIIHEIRSSDEGG